MKENGSSDGALSGIRILDLTRLLPGAYCSMMLADLGAEVIKIEEPGTGDYFRSFPPKVKKESALFMAVNRNKKSLTLNLKRVRGKEIFFKLVKGADVVIEGFRPGVMDKLGIGYRDLKRKNPEIILCSISGYGQDGPYVKKAGHDINYLSVAGILGFTGSKDGKPVIPGIQIADLGGGAMLAALSILAAIIARARIGKGQHLDISLTDGILAWLSIHAGKYFADGINPEFSNELLSGKFACYNIYQTKDGRHISLGALEPKFWSAFCKAIGKDDLIKKQFDLGENRVKLIDEIQEIFLEHTKDEWVELLKDVDCCFEPINNFDEVFTHPQIIHCKMVNEIKHPTEGKIRLLNFPGKLSETPAEIRSAPPLLGEHTAEILKELKIPEEEIANLAKEKII